MRASLPFARATAANEPSPKARPCPRHPGTPPERPRTTRLLHPNARNRPAARPPPRYRMRQYTTNYRSLNEKNRRLTPAALPPERFTAVSPGTRRTPAARHAPSPRQALLRKIARTTAHPSICPVARSHTLANQPLRIPRQRALVNRPPTDAGGSLTRRALAPLARTPPYKSSTRALDFAYAVLLASKKSVLIMFAFENWLTQDMLSGSRSWPSYKGSKPSWVQRRFPRYWM